MPNIEKKAGRADRAASSSSDMEAVIEVSRDEFQARKKRRIEENRRKVSNVFFLSDVKFKEQDNATDPSLPSSSDSEAIVEVSREEFLRGRHQKRRIEEGRSESPTSSLSIPNIKKESGSTRDIDYGSSAPAPAPGPNNMFTPYIFQDKSLGEDSDANEQIDYWRDNLSSKQRLRFALKKILESKVNHALAITAEHKVSTL